MIMKPQDQIKALAELDGCKICTHVPDYWDRVGTEQDSELYCRECREFLHHMREKPYRTSYDAIIPLIQKQGKAWAVSGVTWNMGITYSIEATPAQLCEALLRATGRWS